MTRGPRTGGALSVGGGCLQLPAEQEQLIRDWIVDGRSDEEIASVLLISVKLVRPIRVELVEAMRPR